MNQNSTPASGQLLSPAATRPATTTPTVAAAPAPARPAAPRARYWEHVDAAASKSFYPVD